MQKTTAKAGKDGGFRVIIHKVNNQYKIGQIKITEDGSLTQSGSSPGGSTPDELLASFKDYEESFDRDFVLIDEAGWSFGDGSDMEVKEIRNAVKKGMKIDFNPDDFEQGNILTATPHCHYRIGYDAGTGYATVYQFHGFFNGGSGGEINDACSFGYDAEEFVEDWFMYKHSMNLNMLITHTHSTGTDIVEADLPFTVAQWQAAKISMVNAEYPNCDEIPNKFKRNVWLEIKFSEKVAFSLTYFYDQHRGTCGVLLDENSIIHPDSSKPALQTDKDAVRDYIIKRYAKFIPVFVFA